MPEIERSDAINLVASLDDADDLKKAWIKDELERQSVDAFLKAKEHVELIEMRGIWSRGVFRLLVLIVVSDVLFSWALGFGVLHFQNGYEVPAFIADGLLKTIGLALIIVHFLFSKDSIKN